MRTNPDIRVADIEAVYNGQQAQIYETFFGRQIHVGGLTSTLGLADAAGIGAGMSGIELCCGTGASMRALVKLRDVGSMTGVELASAQVERGRAKVAELGLEDKISFVVGDATATGLPGGGADFVWSEDAWCYVVEKPDVVAEAVRLTRPGGVIAITDWIEGHAGLTDDEVEQLLQGLTFPSLLTMDAYRHLFEGHGCEIFVCEDTGRFGPAFELYSQVVREQFAFDMIELLGFEKDLLDLITEQLAGLGTLGREGKLGQIRLVARRPG
jgi:sarcosine/dimethylglycine N-methyltransferase